MTIAIAGPDGSTFNFPDGTPTTTIDTELRNHYNPGSAAPEEEGSTFGGAIKSVGTGLAKGVIGIPGIPGDIAELGTQGINYLAGSNLQNKVPLPTSAGIQKQVEKVTGPFYQPKGTIEEVLQTGASLLPALAGGPEALATKFATRVALPTAGIEAAGALSEDNPVAKVGGAIAGTVLGHRLTAPRPPQLEGAIQGVQDAANLGYKVPEITGVEYKPNIIKQVAQNAQQDLRSSKFNDTLAPQTFSVLEDLKTPAGPSPGTILGRQYGGQKAATALANAGPIHTYEDIQTARTMLGNIAGKGTPDSAAATQAIKYLDRYVESAPQSHLAKGNAKDLATAIKSARADYAVGKTAERVLEKVQNAELQAASANSGRNVGNATRQKLRSILTNKGGTRGLTQDEQGLIESAVRGNPTGNTIRSLGHYAGGGGGLGGVIAGGAGWLATGNPITALGVPIAGRALQAIGNRIVTKGAEKVVRKILTRSPAYQDYLKTLPPDKRNLAKSALAVGLLGVRPQGLLGQ